MPILINVAPGQTHWGPGVGFFWEASPPPSLPGPYRVEILMTRVEPQQRIWTYVLENQTTVRGYVNIGYTVTDTPLTFDFQATPEANQNVSISVNAFTQDEAIIDHGDRTLPWAPVVALHNELILNRGAQVQGGFTAADRTALNQILAAVYRKWPNA